MRHLHYPIIHVKIDKHLERPFEVTRDGVALTLWVSPNARPTHDNAARFAVALNARLHEVIGAHVQAALDAADPHDPTEDRVLSYADVAAVLGVSQRTVERLVADPSSGIPYSRQGRHVTFREAQVERWRKARARHEIHDPVDDPDDPNDW